MSLPGLGKVVSWEDFENVLKLGRERPTSYYLDRKPMGAKMMWLIGGFEAPRWLSDKSPKAAVLEGRPKQ